MAGIGTLIGMEEVTSGIVKIVIDHPPHNPVDRAARLALSAALTSLATRDDVSVLIITGAGNHFSVGNDINELPQQDQESARTLLDEWDKLTRQLREMPAVVLASLKGYVLGGGLEIALSCDLRIASDDAKFACTATSLGLAMSTYTLTRALPRAIAREMVFTGRQIAAAEAYRLGLLNRVLPLGEVDDHVNRLARELASRPFQAVRQSKRLMNLAERSSSREIHDGAQREVFSWLMLSPEHEAAVRAFLAKSNKPPSAQTENLERTRE